MVRYCDFWEFKNEDDNFAQHVDATMIQVMMVVAVMVTKCMMMMMTTQTLSHCLCD